MKKTLIVLILTVLPFALQAQGFYLRAGTGYGLPAATTQLGTQVMHDENITTDMPSNLYSSKVVTGSYGSGYNFNIGAGYVFTQNFIFDFEAIFLGGRKYQTNYVYKITADTYNRSETDYFNSSATGILFNPSLVFSAGFGKAAPYGRFGIIAGAPRITKTESYFSDMDGTTSRELTWVYKNGMSVGYSAGVGMNWKISENIAVFTEANFTSMTYYPKEADLTKSIVDGTDNLSQLTESQKKILFVMNYDPGAPYDYNKPQLQNKTGFPLSSVSIEAGIKLTLVKVKDE